MGWPSVTVWQVIRHLFLSACTLKTQTFTHRLEINQRTLHWEINGRFSKMQLRWPRRSKLCIPRTQCWYNLSGTPGRSRGVSFNRRMDAQVRLAQHRVKMITLSLFFFTFLFCVVQWQLSNLECRSRRSWQVCKGMCWNSPILRFWRRGYWLGGEQMRTLLLYLISTLFYLKISSLTLRTMLNSIRVMQWVTVWKIAYNNVKWYILTLCFIGPQWDSCRQSKFH